MSPELLGRVGVLLGMAWTSGVNLYLTVAALGLSHRFGWISLPGDLDVLAHPVVILIAVAIYLVEFIADKVPYVDSMWDSVHTFIRPVGGAMLGFMALSETDPVIQMGTALICGTIALNSHVAKATTRVAINASPEPVTNSIASVSEDVVVLGALWLLIHNPIVIGILVLLFIVLSIWFIPKMIRFLIGSVRYIFGKKKESERGNNQAST